MHPSALNVTLSDGTAFDMAGYMGCQEDGTQWLWDRLGHDAPGCEGNGLKSLHSRGIPVAALLPSGLLYRINCYSTRSVMGRLARRPIGYFPIQGALQGALKIALLRCN